jgi:aspartate 1-decarboxylase
MLKTFLRSKIHRATVTSADRDYEGSISICRELCRAAELLEFEQVDVYDITNGARFTTYVIYGEPGQIQVNGAAANLVTPGDAVIVAAYAMLEPAEIAVHRAIVVQVDAQNRITNQRVAPVSKP